MKFILNLLGIFVILGMAYLASYDRKVIKYVDILKALVIQFILAAFIVKVPFGRDIVKVASDAVSKVLSYGSEGLQFVFGALGAPTSSLGFIFAIHALGNIIFISALVGGLYYSGILGFVISKIGWVVGKIFGTTKVESFVAVANMFLGQTDSPILVSKYLGKMTNSEIMLVLVSGMGSMSVSILAGYVAIGIPMESLLIASTLVPIGSIIIAKILYPQTENIEEIDDVSMDRKGSHVNVIDAISSGAVDGMNMAFAIGASLIAIIAIVALINGILGSFGVSLEGIFSYIFAPIGYLMGLTGSDALKAGELLGSKLILNEFVAYGKLVPMLDSLDARTALMLTVSLAGFANVGSIGVCISGISVLCPEKKPVLAKLGTRAMFGGFCVSVLSAMIVGLLMLI